MAGKRAGLVRARALVMQERVVRVAAGGVEGDLRVGLIAGSVAALELVFGLADGHQTTPGLVQFALDAEYLGPGERN